MLSETFTVAVGALMAPPPPPAWLATLVKSEALN